MRATARLVAEVRHGRTRLVVVRSAPPLLLRRTLGAGDGTEVHLVGGAAGPLGGDRLRLEVEVEPGADLCLRTVAASVALPGPDGSPSQMDVVAAVATGGRLAWLPEPLVAATGCRHAATGRVTLADGARLTWRDELVCGRYGEQPGDARVALAVTYGGRPLYQQELAVGPAAPGWDGPAVLDGARATGSMLWVGSGAVPPVVLGPTVALMPLATGPAVLATATAPDAAALRRHLDACAREVTGPKRPAAPPETELRHSHR
jgi:urease accessory protein